MIDDLLLDDIKGMSALDASDMLPAVASSGAQMREALSVIDRSGLAQISKGDQPRNIVVAGLGGSGVGGAGAGDQPLGGLDARRAQPQTL